MIREFGCANGWIGFVQHDSFTRLAGGHIADGGSIYAHSVISFGAPGQKLIEEMFQGTTCNLLIKMPKYAYQREYRIIGAQPDECHLRSEAMHPGYIIEEYGHAELNLGSRLNGCTWKFPVSCLEEAQNGLTLELPQHA